MAHFPRFSGKKEVGHVPDMIRSCCCRDYALTLSVRPGDSIASALLCSRMFSALSASRAVLQRDSEAVSPLPAVRPKGTARLPCPPSH